MKNNMNVWSFILSLRCIPTFLIAISSAVFYEVTGIHPLAILKLRLLDEMRMQILDYSQSRQRVILYLSTAMKMVIFIKVNRQEKMV